MFPADGLPAAVVGLDGSLSGYEVWFDGGFFKEAVSVFLQKKKLLEEVGKSGQWGASDGIIIYIYIDVYIYISYTILILYMVISLLRKYPEIPNQAGFLLIRGGIQKVFLFVFFRWLILSWGVRKGFCQEGLVWLVPKHFLSVWGPYPPLNILHMTDHGMIW